MDLVIHQVDRWFADRLHGLRYSPDVIAYVAGVLSRKRWENADMSKQSVVLAFHSASVTGDFVGFQRIADWVLFVETMYPEHLKGVQDVIESLGRQSYYSCHRIIRGQWRLFEELADELPTIAEASRKQLMIG